MLHSTFLHFSLHFSLSHKTRKHLKVTCLMHINTSLKKSWKQKTLRLLNAFNERILTQDQHQRPVFINANAGLVYVTVPCQGRPPRTRLVSMPPPPFQRVRQDANWRSDATFSYKEADQSVSVLSDQTLNRRLTINWTTGVNRTEDICTVTDNLFHQA